MLRSITKNHFSFVSSSLSPSFTYPIKAAAFVPNAVNGSDSVVVVFITIFVNVTALVGVLIVTIVFDRSIGFLPLLSFKGMATFVN